MDLPIRFLAWYLGIAPFRIVRGLGDILIFNLEYFSFPLLLRTLISPWRRNEWSYEKTGWSFSKIFEVLFSNFISRFLGGIVRLGTMALALVLEALLLAGALIVAVSWFLLIPLIILGFAYGIRLLA